MAWLIYTTGVTFEGGDYGRYFLLYWIDMTRPCYPCSFVMYNATKVSNFSNTFQRLQTNRYYITTVLGPNPAIHQTQQPPSNLCYLHKTHNEIYSEDTLSTAHYSFFWIQCYSAYTIVWCDEPYQMSSIQHIYKKNILKLQVIKYLLVSC